ncbi:type II toxin-antitoxin system VapC family toxin [Propionibacteriaceae bacterium G1746]
MRQLLARARGDAPAGIGSVLLLAEVLTTPMRADPESAEVGALISMLSQLDLRPVDDATGRLALALAVKYGLRAADATHLATAVSAGADLLLTNNRKDFGRRITEVEVVHPDEL